MRCSVILCLLLSSLQVFAQIEQKLLNGQLAYYGTEFYSVKPSKELLYKILSGTHATAFGKPDVIDNNCQVTCYKHTSVGYDSARKIMFGELFKQTDSQGTYVQDVYCGRKIYFKSVNDISNMSREVNIEHTWPQSKFSPSFDKNMQKSDMHHLYPTDSDANNRRANHQFGNSENRYDELNVQECSSSQLTDISGLMIFTPPEKHRGNVARSLFYFAVRYKLFINPAEEMILRQWHKIDPVDGAEKIKHEVIAKYQKVRNPFVDYPDLVEKVSDF